jgi:GAF domain-containing protein
MKLVVCCWNLAPGTGQTEDLKKQMAADAVFASLETCIEQVDAWVCRPTSPSEAPPTLPDTEQAQLAALHDLGLASAKGRQFDEVSGKIAQTFDAPIALVSFVNEVHRPQPDAAGLTRESEVTQQISHQESLDARVIAANEALVSEDVTKDPRFADDPLVLEKGIRFYAGAPLRTSTGLAIGALCIIDTQPREFSESDCQRLQEMADELMSQIEPRSVEDTSKPQTDLVTVTGRT